MSLLEAIIFRRLLRRYMPEFCRHDVFHMSGADVVEKLADMQTDAQNTIWTECETRSNLRTARKLTTKFEVELN